MAKQGMKRPDVTKTHQKNDHPPVPEIQGKAKHGKEKANPIIAGTAGPEMKVWHHRPTATASRTLPGDLGRDNLFNDIPFADLQDL